MFRSAQRPPVICSPALLRRPWRTYYFRPLLLRSITCGISARSTSSAPLCAPGKPRANHNPGGCAAGESAARLVRHHAVSRSPARSPYRSLSGPPYFTCLLWKDSQKAVRRLFRIWDEKQLAVVPLRSSSSSTEFSGPPSSFRRTQYFRPPRSAQTPERGYFFFPFASLRIILSLRIVLRSG